jgi:NAD(P)-dependent dehydrogenase (short-subunit alcohol dehydrogenase family)
MMRDLLDGKRALVTGCRGRLGPVWIAALENAGAIVTGVDLPDYDLAKAEDVANLADDYGDTDILVNNAGVDSRPDLDVTPERVMTVNVIGTLQLTRLMAQRWVLDGRHGVVVNIASLYGIVVPDLRYYDHRADGWVKDPAYGISKAGVIHLTKDLAARYAPWGIRVNALAPGGVVSDRDALTAADPEFARKYTARIPMHRMANPSDLSGPLVFLASDMSRFVTGHCLPVEGGYLAW